jgi:hypothetical protein
MWINAPEIKQRDHLLIKTVLLNNTGRDVSIERKDEHPGNLIHYQMRVGEDWKHLRPMSSWWGVAAIVSGPSPVLKPNATFAEYDSVHFVRDKLKELFVFEAPGEYQLRAYGWCDGKEIVSSPVKVIVRARTAEELMRIGQLRSGEFALLNCKEDAYPLPAKLRALRDIGGSIGSGVRNRELIEHILAGDDPRPDDIVQHIRENMDSIDAQFAFQTLGFEYRRKRDYGNLSRIVDELRDPSHNVLSWSTALDLERAKGADRLVAPERK